MSPFSVILGFHAGAGGSAGFWPGNEAFPRAAFYSYAYPEPAGFRDQPTAPGAAFDTTLGEFILPYDTVAQAPEPDALLLDFLSTTYAAAAETGGWDRAAFECPLGVPGRVRPMSRACGRRSSASAIRAATRWTAL